VRGIAVLLVLAGHTAGIPTARHGVQLFFVLSGFLITRILLRGGEEIDNGRLAAHVFVEFYVRRTLRIMPAYYALLLAGALLDPDTERILSMRPDLVLVYGSQAELLDQLSRAGIPIFRYRHGGLAELTPTFRQLGELTGHVEEAQRVSADIERRLGQVRMRVAGRGRPRTLLVMSREPMSLRQLDASGGVGFLNDLVELAGGANVFADVGRQAVRVSTEMLLARAPEVIVDLHYTGAMDEAQLQKEREVWRPLASIPAVKANRVQLLVGDHLVVPGPRIARAAEEYARAIHPDAFQ